MKAQNLSGVRFGNLTAISRANDKQYKSVHWLCKCDCGNIKVVSADNLRNGNVKSCGCLRGQNLKTHGLSDERLYRIWKAMRQRCNNPKAENYRFYGQRGVKICDDWNKDFMSFYQWSINNGYHSDLTIDRINPDGNYCPGNCRWITMAQQNLNRHSNQIIEFNGIRKTVKEWSDDIGVDYKTLWNRINIYGWELSKALTSSIMQDG